MGICESLSKMQELMLLACIKAHAVDIALNVYQKLP